MVVVDKSQMTHDCAQVIPAGKRGRVDDVALQTAGRFDVWINGFRKPSEIFLLKCRLGPHEENGISAIEFVVDHAFLRRNNVRQ